MMLGMRNWLYEKMIVKTTILQKLLKMLSNIELVFERQITMKHKNFPSTNIYMGKVVRFPDHHNNTKKIYTPYLTNSETPLKSLLFVVFYEISRLRILVSI